MSVRQRAGPVQLVTAATINALAKAVGGDGIFAYLDADQEYGTPARFRCPTCRELGWNGGQAEIVDEWRFRCLNLSCNAQGTRWLLERLVLEDPDALERLDQVMNEVDS